MITFSEFMSDLLFYGIRIAIVALAFYIGYIMVCYVIEPKVLEPMCLTNTGDCITMDIYYYQNTFLAKEYVSQIYFWYDGVKLYIYGQATEQCEDPVNYQVANIFQLNKKDDEVVITPFPNECITSLATVLNYYESTLKISSKTILLHKYNPGSYTTNIFDIIKTMVDNKIFYLI